MNLNLSAQRLCAWSGIGFIVIFYSGFAGVAGFFPPPNPENTPDEVARMFSEDRDRIRVGMLMTSFAAALLVTWSAAFSAQFKRIEGPFAVFGPAVLAMGAIFSLEFIYLAFFWIVGAYRAGREPSELQLINDMSWVPFMGLVSTVMLMAVVMGLAMLLDERPAPIFPRWVGYLNIWCALLMAPGAMNIFFHDGPFAWDGLFAFWLVVAGFTIWIVVNCAVLFRAVDDQERETLSAPAPDLEANGSAGHPDVRELAGELSALREELSKLTSR